MDPGLDDKENRPSKESVLHPEHLSLRHATESMTTWRVSPPVKSCTSHALNVLNNAPSSKYHEY